MLEQFNELLKMKNVLNEKNSDEQIRVSLFIELGELMNEVFKNRKDDVYSHEDKLLKYVEALYFALVLTNLSKAKGKYDDIYETYDDLTHLDYSWIMYLIMNECFDETSDLNMILSNLFILGNKLGFTWEEIYKTYKYKKGS